VEEKNAEAGEDGKSLLVFTSYQNALLGLYFSLLGNYDPMSYNSKPSLFMI